MAGFRKNIHKNIQAGLNARLKSQSKYSTQYLPISPLLGSVNTEEDFELSYEAQASKSPYIRLISPGQTATQILYGTFNETISGDELVEGGLASGQDLPDAFESVQDKIGPADSSYYNLADKDKKNFNFGRPKPGIVDAKIDFIKYGGAVRKATVNWVCFTLDDLQMYTQGSFLSAGRNVILDWGWVRSGKGVEQVPKILVQQGNKIALDENLFAPQLEIYNNNGKNKIMKSQDSAWDMLWKNHYGDWGGMIGVISNFSWSVREDGGFDCMTEILAKGASVFDQPIPTPKQEQLSELPLGQKTFDSFMKDLMVDLADGKSDPDLLRGPALNIKERCNTLDYEILVKCFDHILKAKASIRQQVQTAQDNAEEVPEDFGELDNIELPAVETAENGNIVVILRPTKGGTLPPQAGGDLQIIEYFDEDPDTLEVEKAVKKAGEFATDIWVRWGWFEDNIVSYYATERAKESDCAEAEFRSITTKDDGTLQSNIIHNSSNLYTIDPSVCVLPGQYPESWHQRVPKEVAKDNDYPTVAEKEIYYTLSQIMNAVCEPFAVDDDNWNSGGYLRNIMVNLSQIQSAFSGPGESIQSAMLKLANSLNSGIKIWEFDVDKTDPGDGPTSALTTYYIHTPEGGIKDEEQNEDRDKPEKSYIFENFGFNSLVKEVNMSSTLPDKFAVMAGYGQTRAEEDSKEVKDDIIRGLLRDRGDSSKESKQAKAMGEFYSNPKNKQVIGSLVKTQEDYQQYGHVDPGNDIGEITEEGLDASKWNHSFSDEHLALNPTSKGNFAKQFESKYIDSVSAGQASIAATAGGTIKDITKQKDLNIMAFPSIDQNDELNANLRLEFKKPYDQHGKLRSHFLSTIRWYHEDSPLTKAGADVKTLALPIELSMTLEGCSGLFAGNMFRLTYLPEEMYGQTFMNAINSESPPKSYFHMNSVSHTINENGWDTSIGATLNKYNPEGADQETEEKNKIRDWKKANADKLEAKFQENLNKMIIEETE